MNKCLFESVQTLSPWVYGFMQKIQAYRFTAFILEDTSLANSESKWFIPQYPSAAEVVSV